MRIENITKIIYNGKTTILKNRILDNYLNIFNSFVLQHLSGNYKTINESPKMQYCSLSKQQQAITDSSTTMLYDKFSLTNSVETIKSNNKISTIYSYPFNDIGFGSLVGQKLESIGFGLSPLLPNFLFANIDISSLNIIIIEGARLKIVREDIVYNDWLVNDNIPLHLSPVSINEEFALLTTIGLGFNGTSRINMLNPIVTFTGIGEALITGDLPLAERGQGPLLFPGPQTFPSPQTFPNSAQFKTAVLEYDLFKFQGPNTYTIQNKPYKLVKMLKDLDITFNNLQVSLKYKLERSN